MPEPRFGPDEAVRRAKELYDRKIRSRVEHDERNKGKYLMLDIETEEYEIGDEYGALSDAMLRRNPSASLVALRIGFPALGRVGGHAAVRAS